MHPGKFETFPDALLAASFAITLSSLGTLLLFSCSFFSSKLQLERAGSLQMAIAPFSEFRVVVSIDSNTLAVLVLSENNHVDVMMSRVVMLDCHPFEIESLLSR
ncbi:MAG: hypothetical protein IPM23_21930 [Candidatus Melainabacteria bacterium]|nr:hypothetical protein [Candidatus Melainabacteria bacterium]